MEITIKEGNYEKLGAYLCGQTLMITFESEREDDCAVLFYEKNTGEEIRAEIPGTYCLGSLRSVGMTGLDWKNYNYNIEQNGIIYTDPYARKIVGRECWNDEAREAEAYRIMGAFPDSDYKWENDGRRELAKEELVVYKLHVRGFTMDGGARGKDKGTFLGVQKKISYLKELGVTAIEVMPVYEFEEIEFQEEPELSVYQRWQEHADDKIKKPECRKRKDRVNFWGYTKNSNYFAVKESYGRKNAAKEFKELIDTLHANGMELIMEFFFSEAENHNLILEALRYWLREFHVDGFHLLGENLPITAIVQDALLSRTKIFYTGFDSMLLRQKHSGERLYVYNDEYFYPVRKMINHYEADMNEFAGQQRKQQEEQGFVNYLTSNNGFTLADLFSYERKHNEANGEENADGNDWNYSINCGAEGKTSKKYIKEQRARQLRNAMAVLLLGQAVPLLWAGDECGNSQQGNNNAYCQDNEIGWLDWKLAKRYGWLTEFTGLLLAFRRAHPILAMPHPMKLSDYKNYGMPDLSYHGENAWIAGFMAGQRAVGMMYCGKYAVKKDGEPDDILYIAYNFQGGSTDLALPRLPEKKRWRRIMDTAREENSFLEEVELLENQQTITAAGQSVSILIGK